jgi:hypothetical protein
VKAVDHQGDESFAMGLFVEGAIAVRGPDRRSQTRFCIELLNFGCDIEEALGAQEEAILGTRYAFCDA